MYKTASKFYHTYTAKDNKKLNSPNYLIKKINRYVFVCNYKSKNIPKSAGFKWDHKLKEWYTTDPSIARKLRGYSKDKYLQSSLETRNSQLTKTFETKIILRKHENI